MKKVILALVAIFALSTAFAETKKVCHDKDGKKVCKNITIHKKLDTTKEEVKKK